MDRPSFSQLRSNFSAMLQAGSADEYIDLQVNEEAPYYQIKDDDQREWSNSTSSDGSISTINKQKMVTNRYVPTPEQRQQQRQDDEYIAMASAGSALERPVQLGIPISKLVPASSSSENVEQQMTPVNETTPQDHTPFKCAMTNPYIHELSKVDETKVTGGAHSESVCDSSLDPSELVESTHL